MEPKKSFVFHAGWRDAVRDFPAAVRLEVYEAIFDYATTGCAGELSPVARGAFAIIRLRIDEDCAKYRSVSEARRRAGREGGLRSRELRNALAGSTSTGECRPEAAHPVTPTEVVFAGTVRPGTVRSTGSRIRPEAEHLVGSAALSANKGFLAQPVPSAEPPFPENPSDHPAPAALLSAGVASPVDCTGLPELPTFADASADSPESPDRLQAVADNCRQRAANPGNRSDSDPDSDSDPVSVFQETAASRTIPDTTAVTTVTAGRDFVPPSLEEMCSYFEQRGYTREAAEKAHAYYSELGWTDSRGNSVRNWKLKCIAVWFKDENRKPARPWGYSIPL